MNPAPANSSPADTVVPAQEPSHSNNGWGWRKICGLAIVAFLAHLALIYFFGSKQRIVSRTAVNAPQLQLADRAGELADLDNPALFALPNPRDFASAVWSAIPVIPSPTNYWTESPRWLPLDPAYLGVAFRQFMQSDHFPVYQPNLKSEPQFLAPAAAAQPARPQQSELKIVGPLAHRRLRTPVTIKSWPLNDVIPPTLVQVMVDPAGNVVSTAILPSDNPDEAQEHYTAADPVALDIARQLQFTPSFTPRSTPTSPLTAGEVIFIWHTTPVTATNNPPATL